MKKHNGTVLEGGAVVAEPRADVFTAPAAGRQLPVWSRSLSAQHWRPAWFFVAAHGGAGTSLLSRLTWEEAGFLADARDEHGASLHVNPGYALDAGQALPNPQLEPTGSVIVVCRTTMSGLTQAREVAAQYLAGAVPNDLRVLGLITIADQPGRLPKELASAQKLIAGVYAHTWSVPYIPAYRLFTGAPGDPMPASHPSIEDTFAAIRSLTNPKGQS